MPQKKAHDTMVQTKAIRRVRGKVVIFNAVIEYIYKVATDVIRTGYVMPYEAFRSLMLSDSQMIVLSLAERLSSNLPTSSGDREEIAFRATVKTVAIQSAMKANPNAAAKSVKESLQVSCSSRLGR